ncbi:RidA family protein [Sphingobacterium sp. BN32]|uniref:RidA family protein n=1 Tax=Sphingobacterium sp. BN32 TaxID=3058432 RepID=UPI00265CECEC|nr:RidA family protein [Sphingobacterium sp. BN32]WKK57799.1 RidA family protein [Sphingobacterium sp. BN32]
MRMLESDPPLSDAILDDNWMYVSGQGSVDVSTGTFLLSTIEEETRQTMENIRLILSQEEMGFHNIVKCNVHLADMEDFDAFNAVYRTYFPNIKPARTTVQSVLMRGIKVEIDCVAKK